MESDAEVASGVTRVADLAFSEWLKVFGNDKKLTAALLDSLADRATVIATKGKNYRQRSK
jgi:hypothetical protein